MDKEPKENSDLLRKRSKSNNEINGTLIHEDPPDGGLRAYTVVFGSFVINGIVFSIINSYSVIYTVLEKQLRDDQVPNSTSKAALVGSLALGMTFLLSPISGTLSTLMGLRPTAILGGTIAATGMLLSSFFVHNVNVLYFTFGIVFGLGASLAYTPSLAILGHYFKKYLGLINGIATIGSSVFTVIMPVIMDAVIINYGLKWLFRLLAVFGLVIVLCSLSFKAHPSMVVNNKSKDFKTLLQVAFPINIWKIRKYMFWALSMPVALFGYFVPYVHIKSFINFNFKDVSHNLPLQCIAVTSGVGRLFFGWLADKPGINRIAIQQVAFYFIGIFTIILAFTKVFGLVVAIALGMGLCDGAFIALIGPIAIELAGSARGAHGIGCMLGLAAAPLSIGPPLAGFIFDQSKTYTLPFVLAGLTPIIGASLMFLVHFYRPAHRRNGTTNGGVAGQTDINIESLPSRTLLNGAATHRTKM